jgi:hypothetical protein
MCALLLHGNARDSDMFLPLGQEFHFLGDWRCQQLLHRVGEHRPTLDQEEGCDETSNNSHDSLDDEDPSALS